MPDSNHDTHPLFKLAKSLGRWDNEGGATRPPPEGPATAPQAAEERLLRCLGAAVVLHWSNLPTPIQRDLFEAAASMEDRGTHLELTRQLGRYLHEHNDPPNH